MAEVEISTRKHTVRGFDEDLAELSGKIVTMGGLVERQLVAAVEALVGRDSEAADKIIQGDDQIDELEE